MFQSRTDCSGGGPNGGFAGNAGEDSSGLSSNEQCSGNASSLSNCSRMPETKKQSGGPSEENGTAYGAAPWSQAEWECAEGVCILRWKPTRK